MSAVICVMLTIGAAWMVSAYAQLYRKPEFVFSREVLTRRIEGDREIERQDVYSGFPFACVKFHREKIWERPKGHLDSHFFYGTTTYDCFTVKLFFMSEPVAFGYGILWRGFLLNLVGYIFVLALARRAWKRYRRWVFKKRSSCHDCGYPLVGLSSAVCPECGSNRDAHTRRRWWFTR